MILGVLLFVAVATAQVAVPPLTARVTDLTGTLTPPQRTALEQTLAAFEARHGSQIAVLIVPTTGAETIEQYAVRVQESWKLGRKGVDDGVLLVVAKNDRRLRIEVGYGLEGPLPDALAHRIIEEHIVPRFKRSEFHAGIVAGTDKIMDAIAGGAGPIAVPPADGHVTDLTATLTPGLREAVERTLAVFETRRGSRITVLVVPSTRPETVAQYARRVRDAWTPGGRDVLLVVATDDHRAQLEVGDGLRDRLPDAVVARIVADDIVQYVKRGDGAYAVVSGTNTLMEKIQGFALPSLLPAEPTLLDHWQLELLHWLGRLDLAFLVYLLVFVFVFSPLLGRLVGPWPIALVSGIIAGAIGFGGSGGDMTVTAVAAVGFFLAGRVAASLQYATARGGPSSGGWSTSSSSSRGSSSSSSGSFSGGGGRSGGGGASGSW